MTAVQNQCWKPVITAVNGMVCGGGLHFIADSDIIVCADHSEGPRAMMEKREPKWAPYVGT
jgi:1,4-dihydroxy-2-naphthoyl-CoA synthase